jgi:large subunit ribosomal protein L16
MSKRFTKSRKIRVAKIATRQFLVTYGSIGVKVLASCKLTTQQIESARTVIVRTCQRKGQIFIRTKARFSVSKKPLGVRMGGGKGGIDHYVDAVPSGTVIFELDNVPLDLAKKALEKATYKLGVPCCVVYRHFAKIS